MGEQVDWDIIFKQYKESGLSRKVFCKNNQISHSKFRYRWYKKNGVNNISVPIFTSPSRQDAFEGIAITGVNSTLTPSDKSIEMTLHFPSKIRCDIRVGSNPQILANLLQQLVKLC